MAEARWTRGRALAVTATAAGLLLAGGVAYAAIPSDGVITACYLKSGGGLRVIDAQVTKCKSGETQLSWNIAGVPGKDGADGAAGQDGVSGYELVTNDTVFGSGTTSTFGGLGVACPAGKKVLGGGGAFIDSDGRAVNAGTNAIVSSHPTGETGWAIGYDATTIGPDFAVSVRVYATCATVG